MPNHDVPTTDQKSTQKHTSTTNKNILNTGLHNDYNHVAASQKGDKSSFQLPPIANKTNANNGTYFNPHQNEKQMLRQKVLSTISKIFNPDNPGKPKIEKFNDFMQGASKILSKENNILDIHGNVMVVGDIHGDLNSLMHCAKDFLENEDTSILFLGDYTDRGPHGVECLTLLSILKMAFPKKVFLLRGNHESISMHWDDNGLIAEILTKYPELNPKEGTHKEDNAYKDYMMKCIDDTQKVLFYIAKFQNSLPLAAIINGKYLCAHAGVGPNVTKEEIESVDRKHDSLTEQNDTAKQLLWSDPWPKYNTLGTTNEKYNNNAPSYDETIGLRPYFNNGMLQQALKNFNCSAMIRGHEVPTENGYKTDFDEKLFTIFSSTAQAQDTSYIKINQNNKVLIVPITRKSDKPSLPLSPIRNTTQTSTQKPSTTNKNILNTGSNNNYNSQKSDMSFLPLPPIPNTAQTSTQKHTSNTNKNILNTEPHSSYNCVTELQKSDLPLPPIINNEDTNENTYFKPHQHKRPSLHEILSHTIDHPSDPLRLSIKQIKTYMNIASQKLSSEPDIVDIKGNVMVVGDIQGDLNSLTHYAKKFLEQEDTSILFLGNYTGIKSHGVECLTLLSILKKAFPKKVFLLRGNHDSMNDNFINEIVEKYSGEDIKTMKKFLFAIVKFQNSLPLAAIINGKYLCSDHPWSEHDKGGKNYEEHNNDAPSYNETIGPRPCFNKDLLEKVLEKFDCTAMIRGHEVPLEKGYKTEFDEQLFTIFSSAAQAQDTSYIKIDQNYNIAIVPITRKSDNPSLPLSSIANNKNANDVIYFNPVDQEKRKNALMLINSSFNPNKKDRLKLLDIDQFKVFMQGASKILSKENNILDIHGNVMVVGDIHGDLNSLTHCAKQFLEKKDTSILFLGNYTGIGPHGVECLTLLSILKEKFPDKVFLLKGSHESQNMLGGNNGLIKEILKKYPKLNPKKGRDEEETYKNYKIKVTNMEDLLCNIRMAIDNRRIREAQFYNPLQGITDEECVSYMDDMQKVLFYITEFQKSLPLAAIINNEYLCAHAGVGPDVKKFMLESFCDRRADYHDAAYQLLWDDPFPKNYAEYNNVEPMYQLDQQNNIFYFNKAMLENVLKDFGCETMIRGHQVPDKDGYKVDFDGKLLTIFSSTAQEPTKDIAYAEIDENNNVTIVPIPKQKK